MKAVQFHLVRLAVVICLGGAALRAAQAQELSWYNHDWDFRVGIPLWATGAKGTVGVRDREVHIDDSFTDLLDTLDFIAPLNLEIRKSRFLFFSDGAYIKTSTSGEGRGLFRDVEVDLNQKLFFDNLAIGYAVVRQPRFSLEPFAGAQLTFLEPRLSLKLPILGVERTASTSKFWVDPIVGAYLNYRFSRPAGLYVKGDAGGFDVNSRLTWQVQGGFDFPIARHFYFRLAYHYLNTDFEKGPLTYKVSVHGPQLELGARF